MNEQLTRRAIAEWTSEQLADLRGLAINGIRKGDIGRFARAYDLPAGSVQAKLQALRVKDSACDTVYRPRPLGDARSRPQLRWMR